MKSLRGRLLLPIGVGLALLLPIGGWVLHGAVKRTLERGIDASLEDRARWWADELELEVDPERHQEMESLGAQVFAELARPGADPEARAALLEAARVGVRVTLRRRFAEHRSDPAGVSLYEIRAGDERVLARSASLEPGTLEGLPASPSPTRARPVTLPGGRLGRGLLRRVDEVRFADAAMQAAWTRIRGETPFPTHTAVVLVARDTAEMDGFLHTLGSVLVFLIGALLALGYLLTGWTVRRALAPLRDLRRQIHALDAASLERRVEVEACPSDLQPVIEALNAQLDRLEEAFARERRTTAHIAHELRTPIAEVRSLAEVALEFPEDPELAGASLAGCRDAAEHMTRIVETVLRLARARTEPSVASCEPIDLGALLHTVAGRVRGEAARKEQDLTIEVPEGLRANAEPDAVEALLVNLMENAVRHAPNGTRIRVVVRHEADGVAIEIENACATLDPGDLPHLVEPFWRKDAARTTSGQGGLGLTLADALARGIGAPLAFALEGGRLRVWVRLPEPAA